MAFFEKRPNKKAKFGDNFSSYLVIYLIICQLCRLKLTGAKELIGLMIRPFKVGNSFLERKKFWNLATYQRC